MTKTVKADPYMIKQWAERTKCVMCKHKEDEGHILPGKTFTPSVRWAFHYQDTHGLPHDGFPKIIWNSVYGLPIDEKHVFGLNLQKERVAIFQ